jgi:hypothetical protein
MPDGLNDASPAARVAAIEALRFVHLKDRDTLDRLLDLCADDAEAREVAADDPFRAFFSDEQAVEVRTVGDEAVARIDRAGLPRDSWEALAEALDRHPGHPRLGPAAARWAAETRWTDEVAALGALVPRLQAADVPLLEVVAGASPDGRDVIIAHALSPWHPRTVQELLNHNGAHGLTVEAIESALDDGSLQPDPSQAMLLLGLLVGWESPAAPRVARRLLPRLPWVVAYLALDDPDALPALRAWLDDGDRGPEGLGHRVVEALRQRPPVPGWPLARWVERYDLSAEAFDAWGVDDEAAEVLRARLVRLEDPDEERRLEGWNAAGLLVLEGRHGEVAEAIERALEHELPWDPDFVARLAAGRPPLRGLGPAIARQVAATDDPSPALAAAADLDDDAVGPVVDALLAHAAAQPTVRKPAGRGLVRIERDGVDPHRLAALVQRSPTDARQQALAELEPVVTSEGAS